MQQTIDVDKRVLRTGYSLSTPRWRYRALKLGYSCLVLYGLMFFVMTLSVFLSPHQSLLLGVSLSYAPYLVAFCFFLCSIPFVFYAVVHIFNSVLYSLDIRSSSSVKEGA